MTLRPGLVHGRHPCASCPFRKELRTGYFPPDALQASIGKNLEDGYAHRCHKGPARGATREPICVGFLRFVEATAIVNPLVEVGKAVGVIDMSIVSDKVEIIDTSWEDVLDNHRLHEAIDRLTSRPE